MRFCASGAGAKRQARDAAHIAGDWNPQDGAGYLGMRRDNGLNKAWLPVHIFP